VSRGAIVGASCVLMLKAPLLDVRGSRGWEWIESCLPTFAIVAVFVHWMLRQILTGVVSIPGLELTLKPRTCIECRHSSLETQLRKWEGDVTSGSGHVRIQREGILRIIGRRKRCAKPFPSGMVFRALVRNAYRVCQLRRRILWACRTLNYQSW